MVKQQSEDKKESGAMNYSKAQTFSDVVAKMSGNSREGSKKFGSKDLNSSRK